MSDIWIAIIAGLFGGGAIAGAISSILVSRLSKTRKQQDADMVRDYLGIIGLTKEQLKDSVEETGRLTKDMGTVALENMRLRGEIEEMKQQRDDRQRERDEQIDALSAKVAAQEAQLNRDSRDRDELRRKFGELSERYTILWKYLIEWMEHAMAHEVSPIPPPKELETDPEIMRVLGKKKIQ